MKLVGSFPIIIAARSDVAASGDLPGRSLFKGASNVASSPCNHLLNHSFLHRSVQLISIISNKYCLVANDSIHLPNLSTKLTANGSVVNAGFTNAAVEPA